MSKFALLEKDSQESIVLAIKEAERNTSGEIRVHIESECKSDPIERAIYVFNHLKMGETAQKNGVLVYIAYKSKKISIIGDTGINEKVANNFWDIILGELRGDFSTGAYTQGVCKAVLSIGESLKELFPYQDDDINEQSDEISVGE